MKILFKVYIVKLCNSSDSIQRRCQRPALIIKGYGKLYVFKGLKT